METLDQRRGVLAGQGRALLPAIPRGFDHGEQVFGRARAVVIGRPRQEPFQLKAERLARGHVHLPVDLVASFVALEEAIAGAAEAVPDRLGAVGSDLAGSLPVGLQLLDLGGGRLPVGRGGQGFGTHAQRLLGLEVSSPFVLAARTVLVAPGEELVAGLAEPLPQSLLLPAPCLADGLPLGLQRLDRLAGLDPVSRTGEGLGLHGQGDLVLGILRVQRFQARARLVGRRLEPLPERLGPVGLGDRRGLPALHEIGERAGGRLGIGDLPQGLGAGAQLLLDVGVGPAHPLLAFAQLLDARRDPGADGLQALEDLVVIAAGRQGRQVVERRPHVAQDRLGLLEAERVRLQQTLRSFAKLQQARQVLALVPGEIALFLLAVASRRLFDLFKARLLAFLEPCLVAALAGLAGLVEARAQGARLGQDLLLDRVGRHHAVGRVEPVPLPAGVIQEARSLLALDRLERLDQRQARGHVPRPVGARLLLSKPVFLAAGQVDPVALARRGERRLEALIEVVVHVRHQVGPGILGRDDARAERLAF